MKIAKYLAGALLLASGFQAVAQTNDESKPNVMIVNTPFHQYVFGVKDIDNIVFQYRDVVPDPDNYQQYKEEILNSAYHYLDHWYSRDFDDVVMLQGDELMAICFGSDNYYDNGRAINGSIHCLTLDNEGIRMLNDLIWGSEQTSLLISRYGGVDGKDPEVAPLRAIRAYYHFWAMELFGDVPIMDHFYGEGETVDRRPRAEVAQFIANELEEILSQTDANGASALSKANDSTTYGKPNYWMATALLAKLYLNWGVYTTPITEVTADTPNPKLNRCVELCDELMTCGLFDVGNGYRRKFFPDNGVHISDFIYALDVDQANCNSVGHQWMRWSYYKQHKYLKPQITGWDNISATTAGVQVLTPEAVKKFNLPGDERNQMILQGPVYAMDWGYNFTTTPVNLYSKTNCIESSKIGQLEFVADFQLDDPSIYSVGAEMAPAANSTTIANGTAWLNSRKGARCFKFPATQQDFDMFNRHQQNDYPIFRLADIVLMKAECLLRGATATNGDTPASLMNIVRHCSGAPDVTGTPTIQDLMDERLRELIMEPWRRNDLIRNGMFEDDWAWKNGWYENGVWHERLSPCGTPARDKRHRLFPIHRGILEANTNWQQNPGYQGI